MKTEKLVIHIKETKNQKIIAFELGELSRDEAIIILNRCLYRLLHDYDEYVNVKINVSD